MQLAVPVIGIIRGIDPGFFGEVMQISFAAGLQAIEITMNTENATDIVADYRPTVPEGKLLGMGTIRTVDEAKRAIGAGAMFLVTPNLDTAVIEYANAENIPIVAGALTPTEVYAAWSAGAQMVKVFPCRALGGPQYIRDLLGPFEHIPLAAVGGVNINNLDEYFGAGAKAVGVGASLFGGRALRERDIESLGKNVKSFIARCKEVKDRL